MTSTPDKLRKFVEDHFGSLSDSPVCNILERQGFKLTKDKCWKREYPPNSFEWNCINFLQLEWEYGGYDED